MRLIYKWHQIPDEPSDILRTLADASVRIETDQGDLIFEEDYVPLIDLSIHLEHWLSCREAFEYSPDGYLDNPMIGIYGGGDNICITTPNLRDTGKSLTIRLEEVRSFCASLIKSVKLDLGRLGYDFPREFQSSDI